MLTLKNFDGKPFSMSPDFQPNTCTDTVSCPMKCVQWVSVDPTVLLISLNWLQKSIILLIYLALLLTLVAITGAQQILQNLHTKDKIFLTVYI